MYTMYADDQLIYSPDYIEDNLIIESPTYEKEANKSGSAQFVIYNTNPYYDKIKPLKTMISIRNDDKEVWYGRVLNTSNDFNNRKTVYCEGMLSFFVDSIVRPYEYESKTLREMIDIYISNHNSQVEDFKKITLKTCDVEDLYGAKEWKQSSYRTSKDCWEALLSDYGGYLKFEHEKNTNYLSYLKNPGHELNQEITFGENLLNVTDAINPENIYTILIPIGYDGEGNKITIEPVNDNKDYIESADGIAKFGRIFSEYTFEDDIATPEELLQKGRKKLEDQISDARSITIKAYDLSVTHPELAPIDVYSIIRVVSEVHNIDERQICTKVKINLDSLSDSEYTIGALPTTIADMVAKQSKT